jgi:ribosome-associated toxin RatA of RatAB toxin-antitoxin module
MHSVSKSILLPYSANQMFDLVERVEDYPQFLPWCGGTEVLERHDGLVVATVRIDFKGLKQSFTTENRHERPNRITMRLVKGPFKRLDGEWQFTPLRADACKVAFSLDYAFAGGIISRILAPVFDHIADTFVDAFVRRAEAIHG